MDCPIEGVEVTLRPQPSKDSSAKETAFIAPDSSFLHEVEELSGEKVSLCYQCKKCSSGCPVVSSNTEAIPEIVGDACWLVDPRNVEEIAGALREVLADESLRQELREKGLKRAARFTWEKCARQTAQVYSMVLGKA